MTLQSIWTKLHGTSDYDEISSNNKLEIGTDGSIYIAGYTTGNLDGQTINAYQELFISKYDTDGTLVATRLIRDGFLKGSSIALDQNNNIYISSTDKGDLSLHKYDSNLTKIWEENLAVYGSFISPNSIKISSDNYLYIAGHTGGNLLEVIKNNGGTDAFLAKYDLEGDLQWARF